MNSNITKTQIRKHRPEDETIEWKEYPRIAPGEYEAYCNWGKRYRDPGFKRWLCQLKWDVFSDAGTPLACVPMFLSLGKGEKPRASHRGKYLPAWVLANGGPPSRKDRLTPRVFLHRMALVEVGDSDGPVPYSVVRRIIEWRTGSQCHSVNKSHSQGRQVRTLDESEDSEE